MLYRNGLRKCPTVPVPCFGDLRPQAESGYRSWD
jgi:hypothetical protein